MLLEDEDEVVETAGEGGESDVDTDDADDTDEHGPTQTDTDPEEDEDDGEPGEDEGEPDPEDEPMLKGLPEKTQAKIQKRFGKLTKRAKEAEEKAAAAEERLKGAAFEDSETGLPFPSDYAQADEVKLLNKVTELKTAKKALRPFRHEGYTAGDKTYTASEVMNKLDDLDDELEKLGPRAAAIQTRAQSAWQEEWKAFKEWKANKGKATGGGKARDVVDRVLKGKKNDPPPAPGSSRTASGGDRGVRTGGKVPKEVEEYRKNPSKDNYQRAVRAML